MTADAWAQASNNLVYGAMAALFAALLTAAAGAAFATRRVAPAEAQTAAVAPAAAGAGGAATAVAAEPAAPGSPGRLTGTARALMVVAAVLLGASLLTRGFTVGRVPWSNMYEFSVAAAFVVATAYLLGARRVDLRAFDVWVAAVLLLTLGLAVAVFYVPSGPLVPALQSYWLVIHVAAAIICSGVFTVSMVASGLYVWRDRAGAKGSRYARTLPSAAVLDRVAFRFAAFGFPLWTFAVVAGAIWAEVSWGRYWGWDPKETWAFITWVLYAAYLHTRATAGWKGTRAAWVNVAAYGALVFNFIGVNMFIAGLHSYGGV